MAGETVALGANTDPYQRAEGRYRLMPGIIRALADSGTPFSILTKGTLMRRDLGLLTLTSRKVEVSVAVSPAMVDEQVAAAVEPGAPSPRGRLELIRAFAAAGFPVRVMAAPILPGSTDGRSQRDDLFGELAVGAVGVTAFLLSLRGGAREWFLRWLADNHPA